MSVRSEGITLEEGLVGGADPVSEDLLRLFTRHFTKLIKTRVTAI